MPLKNSVQKWIKSLDFPGLDVLRQLPDASHELQLRDGHGQVQDA